MIKEDTEKKEDMEVKYTLKKNTHLRRVEGEKMM